MKKLLQILLITDTTFLFGLWFMWVFKFESAKKWFDVSDTSARGVNLLKSHVGGTFLIVVVFVLLYFIQSKDQWASAALVAVSAVLFTRFITTFYDGFSNYAAIAIVNELSIIVMLYILVSKYPSIN